MGGHVDAPGQLPDPEHLYHASFVDQPGWREDIGVDLGGPQPLQSVQIDDGVLHPEWVFETLQFRDALRERQLATLEAGLEVAPGARPFGASPGCLAAFARRYPGRRAGGPWSNPEPVPTRGSSLRHLRVYWRVYRRVHSALVLDCDEVDYPRHHAPNFGPVRNRVAVWPTRPSPSARSVPLCLGLAPIADRTCVTWIWPSAISHLRRRTRGARSASW